LRKFGLGVTLALGFEILVTTGGVTGGVAIVVVVEGGVLIVVVGVDDEFVGVAGLVGVGGVVVVVVGVELLPGCLDLRDEANETLLATPCALFFDERAVVESTIDAFLSVSAVAPGELADTGSTTTANVKTLRAIASDPAIAARRAR
jgi:hypothetical protein